jgi:DNA-binding LacI/PurR family transcriptional regulator
MVIIGIQMSGIVPDYVRIRKYIVGLMASSDGDAMQRIPTEREMCELFGTSRTTLRKALKQLEDEGYIIRKPHFGTFINDSHRSMVNFHTRGHKVIGIVLGNGSLTFLPPYHMKILSCLLDRLADENCCGRLLSINVSPEKEFDFLLSNHQFDAFVFIEPPVSLVNCAGKIKESKTPLIVSRIHDVKKVDYCVYSDPFKGAYAVTEYLISKKHRNILFLEDADMNAPVNELKKAGAMAAFKDKGLEWNEKLWHCSLAVNASEKIENICAYQDFTAVSSAEAFYGLIKEKLADKPKMPIIRIEQNQSESAEEFQITAPSEEMGKALAELAVEAIRVPFGKLPPKHIEVGFNIKHPSNNKRN